MIAGRVNNFYINVSAWLLNFLIIRYFLHKHHHITPVFCFQSNQAQSSIFYTVIAF